MPNPITTETQKLVFAVKFPCGYYADKQPGYLWSYCKCLDEAKWYTSYRAAEERGEWGKALISGPHESYTIEPYVAVTKITLTPMPLDDIIEGIKKRNKRG